MWAGDCGTVTTAGQGLPYIVLHAATTTEKLEARGGTESTRRVREEGAQHQFEERVHGEGSWVGRQRT